MCRREQFESYDIGDRLGFLSTSGTCVLEHHERHSSMLYYAVSDFFVEVRFDGPDRHPCMSMTAFTCADPLCDQMLCYLEHGVTDPDEFT
jgi:hypothetical protein